MNAKTLALFFALILLVVPAAQATIVDDINPVSNLVHVGLFNPDSPGSSGTIEVIANVGGNVKTSIVSFWAPAQGSCTVTAPFKSEVSWVISVKITEGPDPVSESDLDTELSWDSDDASQPEEARETQP